MDKNKITKPIILDETAKRQAVALETLAEKVGFLKGDKGDKGDTPIKGQDYYTEVDKAEIKDDVKTAVLGEIHIPTDNNELTNGAGYITSSSLPTKVSELTNDAGFITNSAIPTNISAFTNDSNYQTLTDVQGIIAGVARFTISVVDTLPDTGAPMVLYLVPRAQNLQTETNIYDEYLWIAELSKYEHIGTTAADLSEYAKLADLSAVATSGAYSDLTGKPTIPTVNNPTITIQKNGTKVEDFTLNASTGKTINIIVPTNTNELTNGAGYITADYHDSTKQDVIDDLDEIRSGASKGATALQSVPAEYVTETELDAKGYLTSYTETDPVYTADKPNIALKSEIPTKVSSLTNDANYQTYTDVASMIASIPQFSISIVDALPSQGQKMVLYLVPKTSAGGDDIYDEYIWIENTSSFELVGSTTVDLSDYYTKTETNELIPTTTSQLTNDSGFVTQDSLLEKTSETWTFTLEDGTEVTKTMVLGA